MSENKTPNHLINESSPYLLQHAYNPVQWYPWSESVFKKAQSENKPVLVSIGYSSCHWCHVMEHESFEDENVAAYMNNNFINIKVDREERPDIDQIYMEALQSMTGSGGWPLNIFLMHDKKPFYGGTYFPPQPFRNRPSWIQTLQGVHRAFHNEKSAIEEQAKSLTDHLSKTNKLNISSGIESTDKISDEDFAKAYENLMVNFDKSHGGFGYAPKFPPCMSVQFLFKYYYAYKNEEVLKNALFTLDQMLKGGIYDQLAGGLCRYSTDNKWLAPHFEKMLYDNALFIQCLCDAYTITNKERYKIPALETADFILAELTSDEGLFYSALDADTEGEEGKFYCWDNDEVKKILKDDFDFASKYFDISEDGNWEHKNILHLDLFHEEFAVKMNLSIEECTQKIKTIKQKLLAERNKRTKPGLDDKSLLSWNCMMQQSFLQCYHISLDKKYLDASLKNLETIKSKFKVSGSVGMYHNYKSGKAANNAMLDDYALYIQSLLKAFQQTGNLNFIDEAIEIPDYVISNFYSEEEKFFFYSDIKQKDLIIRKIEYYDSVIPSGNSVMLNNFHFLHLITSDEIYIQLSESMTKKIFNISVSYPASFSNWLGVLLSIQQSIDEITICNKSFEMDLQELNKIYLPFSFKIPIPENNEKYNITQSKIVKEKSEYYWCKNYSCKPPFNSLNNLLQNLLN